MAASHTNKRNTFCFMPELKLLVKKSSSLSHLRRASSIGLFLSALHKKSHAKVAEPSHYRASVQAVTCVEFVIFLSLSIPCSLTVCGKDSSWHTASTAAWNSEFSSNCSNSSIVNFAAIAIQCLHAYAFIEATQSFSDNEEQIKPVSLCTPC